MLTYRNRNSLLQRLHPLTGMLLLIIYIIMFLVINNPIYLMIILLSLVFLSYIDGCMYELLKYGKMILPFALLIMILNPLMVHNGETIIYEGHINYPIIGYMKITLEAVIYGVFSGIRVICVTLAFGFGNLVIHPDRAFGFFSKYLKNSALLMSMTIRLFPTMITSYKNISEIEKLRGNRVFDKKIKKRISNEGSIVNILFLSSLEDSGDMAESMYSRGYGVGKRSSYFYESFSKWDIVFESLAVVIVIFFNLIKARGFNEFNFYPQVDNPITATSAQGFLLCILFFVPGFVNWGCKKWK